MLTIDKLNTSEELEECLDISLLNFAEYESREIIVDYNYCKRNLLALSRRGFVRVIKQNDKIVGWIGAKPTCPFLHSTQTVLHQLYYHSTLQGFSAVKALIMAHDALIEEGNKLKLDLVMTSSILPNKDVFDRILIKQGWLKRSNGLIFIIEK